MYRLTIAALIVITGTILLIGGLWLAALGGSWFYAVLGITLGISGTLVAIRNPAGVGLYALAQDGLPTRQRYCARSFTVAAAFRNGGPRHWRPHSHCGRCCVLERHNGQLRSWV